MWYTVAPRRRECRRVPAEVLCSVIDDHRERLALVVDVSASGLRIQRPLGGPRSRTLQLEFEVPGVDEIVWARGEICFDEVWRVRSGCEIGSSGVLRTTGIRLVTAAERHKRLLRDYAIEWTRQLRSASMWLPGLTNRPRPNDCESKFDFS